jgi:HlyD family secretion protein
MPAAASPAPRPERVPTAPPVLVPEPSPVRRRWLPAAVIFTFAILGAAAYQYWRSSAETVTGGTGTAIPTATAQIGDLHSTIRLNGTLAAQNQATILAPRLGGSRSDMNRGGSANMQGHDHRGEVGGGGGGATGHGAAQMTDFSLVLIMLAPPGSLVKAGDVIARFDPQMQQQRMDDYQDALLQLDANIKSRLAQLASSRERHLLQVQRAEANWLKALQDRKTGPVVSEISAQLYDLAVQETEAQYKQLQFEDELVDQQQQAQLKVLQLSRDQARLEYKRTVANLDRLIVKAPIDGIVVMASVVRNNEFGQFREGDEVHAGQPFMYIQDSRSMVVNAKLNQVDAERLSSGMTAHIQPDAYPDISLPGTVQGIGALAKTSTFRSGYISEIPIQIRLDKMDPRLIPDLTASAEVHLDSESDALFVPRTAVFEENGSKYVHVQQRNGWIRKPVETGLVTVTSVSIRTGLREGDIVALQQPVS